WRRGVIRVAGRESPLLIHASRMQCIGGGLLGGSTSRWPCVPRFGAAVQQPGTNRCGSPMRACRDRPSLVCGAPRLYHCLQGNHQPPGMLLGLTIRDFVLIDRLSLAFRPGLCVLTGETGAGKSILMDALGLALGRRADASLVRPGAEQAAVAAEFTVGRNQPAAAARRLAESRAEEDLLRHEKAELDALAPEGDEEDRLAARRQLLQNAERIGETIAEAIAELDGEGGAQRALARASRRLERARDRAQGLLDDAVAAT